MDESIYLVVPEDAEGFDPGYAPYEDEVYVDGEHVDCTVVDDGD